MKRRRLDEEPAACGSVEAFPSWARAVPGLEAFATGALELRDAGNGFGLGVFATKPVEPGQTLLSVPFSLCVTADSVDSDPAFRERLQAGMLACGFQVPLPARLRLWLYLVHAHLDPRAPHL
ncbi:unnamed protein product, partial [Polarella glacialis]